MTFATPLLLLGLLAALIPLALHLLARARAQQIFFPTLRFLRLSMEKTARRRRIQHLLLMILRMLLLAMLALSVAEPITEAIGGWVAGRNYAAVVLLDNSLSMSAKAGAGTRLQRAKQQAQKLLGGDDKPVLTALITTNGGFVARDLTSDLSATRERIRNARVGYGRAAVAQHLAAAIELLEKNTIAQKSVYLFTDLQRISFEELLGMKSLADARDIHFLVINVGGEPVHNVGIRSLEVRGQRIVDQALEFTATLVNSSPTDKVVDAELVVGGAVSGQRIRRSLAGAGRDGSTATVRFHHVFNRPGVGGGQVRIVQADDLKEDNVRRFAVRVGGKVRGLVVRGPVGDPKTPVLAPDGMLRIALSPYVDDTRPWSITTETVEAEQFGPASLNGMDVAFFCDVPTFTAAQAEGIRQFAAEGGTVMFFLGPDVSAENYNLRFMQEIRDEGGLLPGRLAEPFGEVGPAAGGVVADWVDHEHPFFKGLYSSPADYLSVIVQRYYRLQASARAAQTLIRLENGDPLLSVKRFGAGRVVFCATGASRRWSNLPLTGLFLPMVARVSLLSRREIGADEDFAVGAQVPLRPDLPRDSGADASLDVFPPKDNGKPANIVTVPVQKTPEGHVATFAGADRPGIYEWKLSAGSDRTAGAFAVNPSGIECQLESFPSEAFERAMSALKVQRFYVAGDLDEVNAAAAAGAKGHNWWDLLVVLAILLLVVESVVANRFRRGSPEVPAHLNPALATR